MLVILLTSLALAAQPTKRPKDFDRGGQLYKQNCWMCHGRLGKGNGPAAAALQTDSPALAKRIEPANQNAMVQIILHGRGDMPAFGSTFGEEDAKRILAWLENPKPVKSPKSKSKKDKKKNTSKSRRSKKTK